MKGILRRRTAYCRMIWKKGLLLLPRFVIAIACTAAVLFGVVYWYASYSQKGQVIAKAQVALVTAPGDLVTRLGANAIITIDSVRQVCDIQFMSEKEAEEGIRAGKIDAAIYLTRDIYNDISSGENTPVRVQVSSRSLAGLELFKELLADGMTMLQTGEAMVYSLDAVADDHAAKVSVSDLMDRFALQYVDLAMDRNKTWNRELLSAYGNIDSVQFYTMTLILVVTCVFFGMGFGGLYDRQSRTVEQCLRRTGIGTGTGTLARISVITVVLWTLMALIAWILGTYTELSVFHPMQLLYLAALAFSIAGLIHLIHSWMSGAFGTIFYLLIVVLLFVSGGGVFPPAYLPPLIRRMVPFLPIHLWQQFLTEILWGSAARKTVVQVLFLGAVMIVAGSIGMRCTEDK